MNSRILFIHHSTGGNLIREGRLRQEIKRLDPAIQFWDHSYNLYKYFPLILSLFTHHKGLTNFRGDATGRDYNIVLSNNSPKEYAEIFSRSTDDPTLKKILNYDVVAFKNCYPTTRIDSEEILTKDKYYYEAIIKSLKKNTNKKFILLTPPPERSETTTPENAARAVRLVQFLKSSNFLHSTKNVYIFDLFGLLADSEGFLKKEYCRWFFRDSHPNKFANKTIAPIFAKYLVDIANQ